MRLILKVKNASTENEKYKATEEVRKDLQRIQRYNSGLVLAFKNEDAIDTIYAQGNFITAFFLRIGSLLYNVSSVRKM